MVRSTRRRNATGHAQFEHGMQHHRARDHRARAVRTVENESVLSCMRGERVCIELYEGGKGDGVKMSISFEWDSHHFRLSYLATTFGHWRDTVWKLDGRTDARTHAQTDAN